MLLGQTLVRDFLFREHLRNNAMNLAALFQNRICNHAHNAFVSPTVDQFKLMSHQGVGQVTGCFSVDGAAPGV